MDKHDVVSALKQMVGELGRLPIREEFISRSGITRHVIEANFGGFKQLKQAAGYNKIEQKITNAIFEKPIEKHLEEYKPPTIIAPGPYPTALIISDLHWPFHSQRVLDRFYKEIQKKKPQFIILNGDAWDMYSHTKFPRSHNIFTPRDERMACLRLNREFWLEVLRISPDSQCFQLIGNHDLRPMKRILESYPEAEDWIRDSLERDFSFPGVKTVFDSREELALSDEVIAFHGYRTQLGAHRDYTLLNCINGHSHVGGVVFRSIRNCTLWELNSGYAGDPGAKGLTYTPQKIVNWTPGFGELLEDGPRFVPC